MNRFTRTMCRLIFIIFLFALSPPETVISAESVLKTDAEIEQTTETSSETEDDLAGFEEGVNEDAGFTDDVDIPVVDLNQSVADEDRFVTFGGFFKEDLGYSYQHEEAQPEFSRIRSILNLNFNFRLMSDWRAKAVWNGFYDYAYSYFGRENFSAATLDSYESDSEIRDLFIDGSLFSWLRLKIGRQIIAWGQSDVEQINDMANPRDMQEMGLVDLEDARVPILASKISLLVDSWEINLVAINEFRSNKTPAEGSEFDPLSAMRSVFAIQEEEEPENSTENTEYLVRVFKSFNGGDFAWVWADVYNDAFHLDFNSYHALQNQLSLTPRHKRIQSFGFSGNMVKGAWLFKAEMAKKTGVAIARNQADLTRQIMATVGVAQTTGITFFNRDSQAIETWSEKDLLQLMAGFEYTGFDDISIGLEGDLEKIEDYEDNLGGQETSGSISLQVSHTALNDTLTTRFFLIHLNDNNGDVYRINLDYDLIDAVNLSGGWVVYEATETNALVYPFRMNDRFFTALKYSF